MSLSCEDVTLIHFLCLTEKKLNHLPSRPFFLLKLTCVSRGFFSTSIVAPAIQTAFICLLNR